MSIGYEGRTVTELVEVLQRHDVATVADVRQHASSRTKGFSKGTLAATLAEAGIGYRHLGALGNPRDDRTRFRSGDPDARARYAARLALPEGVAALAELVDLTDAGPVAVLCLEADHEGCHRSAVIDAVGELRPGIEVVHA